MTTKHDQLIKDLHDAVDKLAPYLQSEFPAMGNRTPGSIVDDAGAINELKKHSEKVVKILNGIVDTKMMPGEAEAVGEVYRMKLLPMTQNRLSQAKVEEYCEANGLDISMFKADIDITQHRYSKA